MRIVSSGLTCDREFNYSGCKHCHQVAISPASFLEGATERKRVCPSLAFVQYISESPPLLAVGENLPLCVMSVGVPAAAGSLLYALQ